MLRPNLELHRLTNKRLRIVILLTLIICIMFSHLTLPDISATDHRTYSIHMILYKLYLLPIILAALWFNFTGAIIAALLVSATYVWLLRHEAANLPHYAHHQLSELASIWIMAIAAGLLISREKALLWRLNKTLDGTVKALVSALDCREHITAQHSLRVTEFALKLARKLQVQESDLEALRCGALLHDVGKIGVPDGILLKAGPLEECERAIIQRHPELGMQIIGSIPFMEGAAQIVRSHHERYDGSGYPDHLHAEQIPLGARIFAVADVFDALTSSRPYHDPMSETDARTWILSRSGRDFDPKVVSVLDECFTNHAREQHWRL